jgi:hypothetical protein
MSYASSHQFFSILPAHRIPEVLCRRVGIDACREALDPPLLGVVVSILVTSTLAFDTSSSARLVSTTQQ